MRAHAGGAKPARPEPEFQEPCGLVPAAAVPPRDAPPALMDTPDDPDAGAAAAKEKEQAQGPQQVPPLP